jgi:hypothetical protein
MGPGRNAVEGRLIPVEHRDRYPFTGRHGGHGVLFVFRDAYGGFGQHAVRHRRVRPAQDCTIDRVSGLGFGRSKAALWTDQGRSYQPMQRPSSETPCEKVEPIAGIFFHPQSTSGLLPAHAKRADRLRANKIHPWTRSG